MSGIARCLKYYSLFATRYFATHYLFAIGT
ncbi:hypothetical protein MES5069_440052 [Mesorhizobium escarrei]|uniref:Uncharacterized protein n=1 Tax=Mesorhizobium escarrei TaxID=666018 RepID=A0ABN8K7W4_9HYPH|nr:hypothetical protein MES5069_440052 [Mesorhizobium escarrei]